MSTELDMLKTQVNTQSRTIVNLDRAVSEKNEAIRTLHKRIRELEESLTALEGISHGTSDNRRAHAD
jgi:uncharacterized coiled-coil DUF342 family protein